MDRVHEFVNIYRNGFMPTEFFHATSSSILAGLPKTNYNVCDVTKLIMDYQYAPMSGELFCGGLSVGITSPGVAFSTTDAAGTYTLTSCSKRYGSFSYHRPHFTSKAALIESITNNANSGFSHVYEIIVKLMRDKQFGSELVLTNEEQNKLINNIDDGFNQSCRQWLANYLIPSFLKLTKPLSWIRYEMAFDILEQLINIIPLDLLSYTHEEQLSWLKVNLEKLEVADVVEKLIATLEDGLVVNSTGVSQQDTLPLFRFVSSNTEKKVMVNLYDLQTAFIGPARRDFIKSTIYKAEEVNPLEVARLVSEHITNMDKTLVFLKKLITSELSISRLSSDEISHLSPEQNFPIVFFTTSETSILEKEKYEYRCFHELKLGEHITKLSVPETRIEQMLSWLKKHGISGVEVIALESLIKTKTSEADATTSNAVRFFGMPKPNAEEAASAAPVGDTAGFAPS